MGIVIKSTSSTDEMKVDATSNAARVTLYDTAGNALTGTEDSSLTISLSALSATAELAMAGHNGVGFTISNLGHANNVLTCQYSTDGTWVTVPAINTATGNTTPTVTATGTYTMRFGEGVSAVRLIVSSYTSGTVTGEINASYANAGNVVIRSFSNVLSVVNSTSAQLASSATFTGAWEADLYWQGVTCNVFADQPLTVTLEQSLDGTTVTKSDSWNYNASSTGRDATKSINLISNYHRFKITNNGAIATTTLNFNCYSCPNFTAMPVSQTSLGAMPTETPSQSTYRAAVTAFTPVATLFFSIKGSATRIVKVTRWGYSITNSNLNTVDITVTKYSAIATGTAASVTMVPLDSSFAAATALVQSWSVTPGTQTAVGVTYCERYNEQTTANTHLTIVEGGNNMRGSDTLTLRGTSQWAGLTISSVTNSPVGDFWVEWIEI